MKNKTAVFTIPEPKAFKLKMLNWSSQFNIFCFLDNQEYSFATPSFECALAAGCEYAIKVDSVDVYHELRAFSEQHKGWLFGHFGYHGNAAAVAIGKG